MNGYPSLAKFTAQLGCLIAGLLLALSATAEAQLPMPQLAPGVLKVIPAEPSEMDTATGPVDFAEVSRIAPAWEPHFAASSETLSGLAGSTTFRRPVWQLEFAFKPMRMLTVPIPSGDGTAKARRIWYLLYRIRNTGGSLKPVAEKDEFGHDRFVLQSDKKDLRFMPIFALRAHEYDKEYADHVLPEVLAKIHRIEIRDPRVKLYDSISITQVPITTTGESIGREYWGVATWDNIERRTDFFSVYVQGLTNAYRFEDTASEETTFGAGRKYAFRTLKLNFYRPGDAVGENGDEFRYGLPLHNGTPDPKILQMYDVESDVDHAWVYRP
jgi:hypothetical protein